jgi:hypothetical protein
MSFFSIKDFTTSVAAKVRSVLVNTDENLPAHIIQDSAGNEVLGTKTDAKATQTDTTSVSLMAVQKEISFCVQALAAIIANGGFTINSAQLSNTGQNTSALSAPVVLPSDPDLRPAAGNITAQDVASSSATGQDSVSIVTGTPTAASFRTQAINGHSAVRVQITGTWTGTLQFEVSADAGTTWIPIPMRITGTVFTRSTVTGNGVFYGDVSGATNFRVRETAAHTGTAAVAMDFSTASGAAQVLNPLRIMDNVSGASAAVKAASTAPVASDTAVVTTQRPDEVHLGEVGGKTALRVITMTADTAILASGDIIADTQQYDAFFRKTDGTGVINSITITEKDAQGAAYYILIHRTSTSMGTENIGPSITDANFVASIQHIIAVATTDFIAVASSGTGSGTKVAELKNLGIPVMAVSGTDDLYISIINGTGTPTYASGEIQLGIGVMLD